MSFDEAPDFVRGLALYERGDYWDAHEAWESVWRSDREADWSDFVQGLIQVAAAFHKLYAQHRATNAAAILGRALARLERYPPSYGGIDLAAFSSALHASLRRIEPLEDGTTAEPGLAPRIERTSAR